MAKKPTPLPDQFNLRLHRLLADAVSQSAMLSPPLGPDDPSPWDDHHDSSVWLSAEDYLHLPAVRPASLEQRDEWLIQLSEVQVLLAEQVTTLSRMRWEPQVAWEARQGDQ